MRREVFEVSRLVYSATTNSWHCPSQCVWADGRMPISDLTAISLQYPDLEEFFKTMLSVQSPDLSMHVRALAELSRHPLVGLEYSARIKEAIFLISSLNPTENDLQPLSSSNIFRVCLANGNYQYTNKAADFAINDRRQYEQVFENRIAILDFSLEEARAADFFFKSLKINNKYLSASVSESTMVANGNHHAILTQFFQDRAFAFCRWVLSNRDNIEDITKLLPDTQCIIVVLWLPQVTMVSCEGCKQHPCLQVAA